MRRNLQRGFTLVELVIVMAVIAVILAVVMPTIRGMQQESMLTKAEGDIKAIKAAVTSYWRNNNSVYPPSIVALTTTSPQMLSAVPVDHWNTGSFTGEPGTYGYITGTDSTFGDWFLICTVGPQRNSGGGGGLPSYNPSIGGIDMGPSGSGDNSRCASNAALKYSNGSRYAHTM